MIGAAALGTPAIVHAQKQGTQSAQSQIDEIYRLVNQHRVSKGLKPLKMNDAITKEASKHSRNMASGKVGFGHDGFQGRSDRLMNGIANANASGENVEMAQGSAKHIVDNWLHSPVHKKNIEGNFTLTGIGMSQNSAGQVYYTQIFIKN